MAPKQLYFLRDSSKVKDGEKKFRIWGLVVKRVF